MKEDGSTNVMLATDLVARGVDIPQVREASVWELNLGRSHDSNVFSIRWIGSSNSTFPSLHHSSSIVLDGRQGLEGRDRQSHAC